MESNSYIHNIFPSPIACYEVPLTFSNIITSFYNIEMRQNSPTVADYGVRSKSSYVLNDPLYNHFSSYILNQVSSFGSEVLGYDYSEYKFTQSWISIKRPNEEHIRHTHPNSAISGVFYFGEVSTETPGITFHKPLNYSLENQISLRRNNSITPYNAEEFHIQTYPGLLIIFPSWLQHSVPKNNSDKNRYSLAFNSIPSVGLGDEECLTELKI